MIKYFSFTLVVAVFIISFSCNEKSSDRSTDEIIIGQWEIIEMNDEKIETKAGLQFAPNKQFFDVDSQGKIIPRLMEKIWTINSDTLKLVDFNWEPDFIEKKGTKVYLIKELNDEILHLELLNKQPLQTIVFKRLK